MTDAPETPQSLATHLRRMADNAGDQIDADRLSRAADLAASAPDPRIAALVDALAHAQYGLSWAVRYFKDQDVTKDDPCPPCSRGLVAVRAALAAWKGGDA